MDRKEKIFINEAKTIAIYYSRLNDSLVASYSFDKEKLKYSKVVTNKILKDKNSKEYFKKNGYKIYL